MLDVNGCGLTEWAVMSEVSELGVEFGFWVGKTG
jgi:hypothetical protein